MYCDVKTLNSFIVYNFFLLILETGFQQNVQNVILPLDRLTGPLDFAWGAFKILYTVRKDETVARAYIKVKFSIIFFCWYNLILIKNCNLSAHIFFNVCVVLFF